MSLVTQLSLILKASKLSLMKMATLLSTILKASLFHSMKMVSLKSMIPLVPKSNMMSMDSLSFSMIKVIQLILNSILISNQSSLIVLRSLFLN